MFTSFSEQFVFFEDNHFIFNPVNVNHIESIKAVKEDVLTCDLSTASGVDETCLIKCL